MGLIKPNNYDPNEVKFSLIASALSHPARNRVIEILQEERFVRNIDLIHYLNLSKASITRHISCMKRAKLIECKYYIHFDELRLVPETLEYFKFNLENLSKHQ